MTISSTGTFHVFGATHNRNRGDDEAGSEKQMGQLIAETLPARVLRDEAEMRAATAFIAVDVGAARCAGIPGRQAGRIRFAGQPETGQRQSYKTAGELFKGLTPRCGLSQTFRQ
jgi:hypothetical protein